MVGHILSFQLIYTGKTERSLPNVKFPRGFCLAYNPKHWSNVNETLRLIEDVLVPYIAKNQGRKTLTRVVKKPLVVACFQSSIDSKNEGCSCNP